MFESATKISEFLGFEKTYVLGDDLCFVDFQLFELLNMMNSISDD
jgi:hypothetical protein